MARRSPPPSPTDRGDNRQRCLPANRQIAAEGRVRHAGRATKSSPARRQARPPCDREPQPHATPGRLTESGPPNSFVLGGSLELENPESDHWVRSAQALSVRRRCMILSASTACLCSLLGSGSFARAVNAVRAGRSTPAATSAVY